MSTNFRKEAYPLGEAIRMAALQNFKRDTRVGLIKRSQWEEVRPMYEEEAREVLTATGENYEPEGREPLILVKG